MKFLKEKLDFSTFKKIYKMLEDTMDILITI